MAQALLNSISTAVVPSNKANAIASLLNSKNAGQLFSITVRRAAKCFKGTEDLVEKESKFQGQLCDYSARNAVKTAVEAGDRNAPELPSHILTGFKIGEVRFWRGKNGTDYLLIPINGNKAKVQWYLNGNPVAYSKVSEFLLASEKVTKKTKEELADKGQVPFVCVKVDNVTNVV